MRGKKTRFFCSLLLSAVMILGALAGCSPAMKSPQDNPQSKTPAADSSKTTYYNATGFPIVKEPITIKAMIRVSPVQSDYSAILVWQEYEKMTGIKIAWDQVPWEGIDEKRNLAFASRDLPDMFFRCNLSDADQTRYGNEGALLKLNDMIDKHAPNLKAVISNYPDVRRGLSDADGNVWAFPTVYEALPVLISLKPFINKKWVDTLNLKIPETTEELYSVLKAFREKDPNGNGKQDEIPLSAANFEAIRSMLEGAWGLGNRGSSQTFVDADANGKPRFKYTDPKFKDMLAYLNKLYTERLLDQEIFTMQQNMLLAKGEQNVVGMFPFVNTTPIGATNEKYYVGLSKALQGPQGDQLWGNRRTYLAGKSGCSITSVNKYPEATVRWMDYFYGDEGAKMFYMGKEGVSYRKTADGQYEYLPEIIGNIPKGSSFDQVISKYVPYAGGGNAVLLKAEYFKGGETQPVPTQAAKNLEPYLPKQLWGSLNYTKAEQDELAVLRSDIEGYVNQMIPEFITGKTPLTGWDDYVAKVKKFGLDKYLAITDAGRERYEKK